MTGHRTISFLDRHAPDTTPDVAWPVLPAPHRAASRVRAWWYVSSPEQAQGVTATLARVGLVADVVIRTGLARVVVEHEGRASAEVARLIRGVDLHARPVSARPHR